MRVPITFIDANGKPTDDYIEGLPSVRVNIHVGYQVGDTPNFTQVWALIDTGSNHTVIGYELSQGHRRLREVLSENMKGAGFDAVYSACVQIDQLDRHHIEVGRGPFKPEMIFKMIVGRNLISKYRMVMDARRAEFYLETFG